MSAVLLVTADHALTSAIPRLCALAGLQCEVERDSGAARAAWRSAGTVLVGSDVAPALAAAGVARRDRVLVLTTAGVDETGWHAALAVGASGVFQMPEQQAELVDTLRAGISAGPAAARVVAVLGGRGGAGASTLAAALAIVASQRGKTVLIDGDPLGGGLDVLIGAESAPGVRWNELANTRGHLDAEAFASAICDLYGIGLLSWGRSRPAGALEAEAVDAVLTAARHAFATVVIDVARMPSRGTHTLLEASDESVIVVPADVRAVAATAALVSLHGRRLGSPHLVVRDPGGGRLSAKDVASSLGLSLVATLRSETSVQTAAQRGEPPVRRGRCALTQTCEDVLAVVTGAA